MTKRTIVGPAPPWAHTEGIGSGFVDTPRAALKTGAAPRIRIERRTRMTDASQKAGKPLREPPKSPHLVTGGLGSPLLWRWHITMTTSILHRATGVALYIGMLVVAAWAIALAAGPDRYADFKTLLGSWPGKVVMFGLTLSAFFHLASGVRHIVWDSGRGLELKSANASSIVIFAFAVAATVSVWGIAAMTGAI